jgi:hypothetical protein
VEFSLRWSVIHVKVMRFKFNSETVRLGASGLKNAPRCQEGGTPTAAFMPCLGISSIWLFLSCILYNELVIVSLVLSWVLSHSCKLSDLKGVSQESTSFSQVRSVGNLGIQDLWGVWSGASLVGYSLWYVGFVLTTSTECRNGIKVFHVSELVGV